MKVEFELSRQNSYAVQKTTNSLIYKCKVLRIRIENNGEFLHMDHTVQKIASLRVCLLYFIFS